LIKIDFNSFVHYTYLSLANKLRFTDYKSLSRAVSPAGPSCLATQDLGLRVKRVVTLSVWPDRPPRY